MSAHTPRPWVAQGHIVRAVVDGREVPVSQGFTLEDARLIAAAPELFAALCELVRWQETGNCPPIARDWAAARAALAKATGAA